MDGVIKCFLLFLPGELLMLFPADVPVYMGTVTALFGIAVSVVLFTMLARKEKHRLWRFYLLSQVFFVCAVACALVNYIELHLFLIPRRELGNGEGLIMLFSMGMFLLLSELVRIVLCASLSANERIEKRIQKTK